MVRRAVQSNVFSRGVLGPLLSERTDLEHYPRGMEIGENIFVLPQGGFQVRSGARHLTRLRRVLRRYPLTSGMVSMPNGGTAGNVVNMDEYTGTITTSDVSGTTFVVAQIDIGSAISLAFVDCLRVKCEESSADQVWAVQYSTDNSTWTDLGARYNIRTARRSRRFAAGAGVNVTARYVRMVITGAPTLGVIDLGEMIVWQETDRVSQVRRFGFSFNNEQTYTMVATDRNLDVFRDGTWQASVQIPHRSDQLPVVTRAQSRDTMLLWHPEVQPPRIFRQGAHYEWDSQPIGFENVGAAGTDTSFGAAQNEVQQVRIENIGPTDTFQLVVGDAWTVPITVGSYDGTVAADIKAALEALPQIETGIAVTVTEIVDPVLEFNVLFGGDNGGRVWPNLHVDVAARDDAVATVATIQDGRASGGALASAETGWARCGTFTPDDRLVMAGFALAPDTLLASRPGLYFDFDQTTALESEAAAEWTIGSDDQVTIRHVFYGRHLQIFCDSSEWYVSSRGIDPVEAITTVNATRNGAKAGIGPVLVEGATLFVDAGGGVVRDFLWDDGQQAYVADSLTLLGSHLLNDIADIAYLRAAEQNEGSQIFIVNGDGTLVAMTFMRTERVRAMTLWRMADGLIRGVHVDGQRQVDLIVERTVGGVTGLYLERMVDDALLDHSVAYANAPASAVVSGLSHLEGKEVWATADGYIEGPYTVSGGQITLSQPASAGEVGQRVVPVVKPMPYVLKDQAGRVRMGSVRMYGATLSMQGATSIAFAANGAAAQDVPLSEFNMASLDVAPLDAPLTGDVRLDRLFGRHDGAAICEITQLRPGRLTVRAIKMEVG